MECRAALSAIALPGEEPTRNLELICDSVNARDDASAAVALDLFLGSGRIGAVGMVQSFRDVGSGQAVEVQFPG